MVDSLGTAVIIDNGSGWIKAGLSGEDDPTAVFPTVVQSNANGEMLVGDQVGSSSFESSTDPVNPIKRGTILDWDCMEKAWQYTFHDRLHVAPEDHPVLLSDAPLNPKAYREKMAQIMFERFSCPAVYMAHPAVLSLYAAGRTSGIVLDCGHEVSYVVPVYKGYPLPQAIKRLALAGRSLTEYLATLLTERGTSLEIDTVRQMKERLGYVALDFDKEMKSAPTSSEKIFQLPDGNSITVGHERFRCPEALFQPSLMELKHHGIQQALFDSIMQCDIDVRKDLFTNVILAGGSTMFDGLSDRLERDLKVLAPDAVKVKVIAPEHRMYSAWRGGSNLATLLGSQKLWITREEYDEFGSEVLQRKCL